MGAGSHGNDDEGSAAAVDVVAGAAGCGSTEHGRVPQLRLPNVWHRGQLVPPIRDGVPDAEVETQEQAEEDPAVAGVERAPVVVGAERAGGGGGEEARDIVAVLVSEIAEETEHGGRAVELRESSAEAAVGDDAAPGLADDGGADEARGIRRREA